MLDKFPKLKQWQLKLGVIGAQLVAVTLLLMYIFSSPIDRDETKRAKTPTMIKAVAAMELAQGSLSKTQWHYANSPTIDIPINVAMALVVRDAKAGPGASLVPAIGMHDSATRPVGEAKAAADLSPVDMGKWVYANKGCMGCHTVDAGKAKLAGPTWGGMYGTSRKIKDGAAVKYDDAYIIESIEKPMAKIADGYPPAMPVLKLKPKELAGVIAYIKSLANQ